MAITAGQTAPDFTLPDENGKTHHLSDYRGKKVVLFFYPQDDTSGCTKEACNFRDDYLKYKAMGAQLLGVSPDDEKSHTKFKEKFSLPYPLLADVSHKVCDKYGVWGEKKSFGHSYDGVRRTTFVIDEKGKVAEVIAKIPAGKINEKVLAILNEA